jgi:methylglutamate dehydrogenase subunit B
VSPLSCPFCGERELREFEFRKTLPVAGQTPFEQVYLRRESPEDSLEHWQHVGGCRAWLWVRRNALTGEVREVRLLPDIPHE